MGNDLHTAFYRLLPAMLLIASVTGGVAWAQSGEDEEKAEKPTARKVIINGVRLTPIQLGQLEQAYKIRIQEAEYWYDPKCGAWGVKGGPTAGFIVAGLDFGKPMAEDASGGDTKIYVNGRELHRQDVLALQTLVGPIQQGRYYLDAMGNVGYEGGPVLLNLVLLVQAARAQSPGNGIWRSGITGIGGGWDANGNGYVMGKDWSVSY